MPFNIASDLYFDIKLLDIDLAWVSCLPKGLGERRSALPLFRFHLSSFPPEMPDTQANIDLIHGTCHLCTHFKIDRIKAICMSYIFQGGKQVIKFANESDCGWVCYSLRMRQWFESLILQFVFTARFMSLLLAGKTSKVATALKKLQIVTSTHNLPWSSLR